MAKRPSRASVELDVAPGKERIAAILEPDTPFQLLIVADFSGRANRQLEPFTGRRRLRQVDADNLDQVLAEMDVALELPNVELQFREIDDFHPDRLYQKVEAFQKLAEARTRPAPEPSRASPPAASHQSHQEIGRGVLESMLADEDGEDETSAAYDLPKFIEKATAGQTVAKEDPRARQWAEQVDAKSAQVMRAILHHPDFQAMEAAWRAVAMLIQRLQPDAELKIFLFDATLDELAGDPQWAANHIANPRAPWAAIACNFTFGQTVEDAARLQLLGQLAAAVEAPFLAEAQPPAEDDTAPHWTALRHSAEASWIGLAVPRFLLRLPYGKNTSPVESFDFEEMPESVHGSYLWGNPAFACACLLGEAFREDGWQMRPGQHNRLEGLPLHTYDEGGEPQNKPCAEVLLTESDAEFLVEQGLMPLASLRDQDTAVLVRFQSIADPPKRLSGRWA